jgi:hypothetical protein
MTSMFSHVLIVHLWPAALCTLGPLKSLGWCGRENDRTYLRCRHSPAVTVDLWSTDSSNFIFIMGLRRI